MSRWTPDEHGCIYDEAGCFARLTPNKAGRLASRHNADIDALTAERDELQGRIDTACERLEAFCAEVDEVEAERDELQRRLDAVVASLKPDGPPIPGGMFDKEVRVLWRAGIELHTKALAIAEGREG